MIDITQNTGKTQAAAMMENRFDFHFAHLSMLPRDGRLDYFITHRDKLVLVVPKGHRLAQGRLDFNKLFQEKFIMISQPESPQLYSKVMEICTAHNAVRRSFIAMIKRSRCCSRSGPDSAYQSSRWA